MIPRRVDGPVLPPCESPRCLITGCGEPVEVIVLAHYDTWTARPMRAFRSRLGSEQPLCRAHGRELLSGWACQAADAGETVTMTVRPVGG